MKNPPNCSAGFPSLLFKFRNVIVSGLLRPVLQPRPTLHYLFFDSPASEVFQLLPETVPRDAFVVVCLKRSEV